MDLRGIKNLTIFSREVIFTEDSRLDLSAPDLVQDLNILPPGSDGDDGKHGVHGPTGELRAAGNSRPQSSVLFLYVACVVQDQMSLVWGSSGTKSPKFTPSK